MSVLKERQASWIGIGAFALLMLALPSVVSCGGGSNDHEDAETAIRAVYDAYNTKNSDAYLSSFTVNGLEDLGTPPELIANNLGDPPAVVRSVRTESTDSGVTADVENVSTNVVALERFKLVKQDGVWKVDGYELLPTEIPQGVTAVDVGLTDSAFVFEPTAFTSGNVGLRIHNDGAGEHTLMLKKVPEGFDPDPWLRGDEAALPTELDESVGFAGPFSPNEEGTLVLAEPLAAGRYVFACFIIDQMRGDFTIR